jgi:hypothetical protein
MNRRAFVFAGLALSTAGTSARAAAELKVIYVGGWDCAPCSQWKNKYKATRLASLEYHKVTWVEIESPKLKEAYQERHWPEELRPVLQQIPHKSGTPRFLIVKEGRIVSNQFGGGRWETILVDLKKLLG